MRRVAIVLVSYALAISLQSFLIRLDVYRELYAVAPFWVPETIKTLLAIGLCLAVASALWGRGIDHFALSRGALRGLTFGFVATTPMLLGFALTRRVAIEDAMALLFLAVLFPLGEEIVSRGFAFRALHVHERWPWWSAAIVVALVTGAMHVEKARTAAAFFGLFLVTGVGGALFCWLLARWNSLWFPFALHMFMNLWWGVFSVAETALGGSMAFAAQIASAVAAILITLKMTPSPRRHDQPARKEGTGSDSGSLRASMA